MLFVRFVVTIILRTDRSSQPQDHLNAEVNRHMETYEPHDVRDIIDMYLAEVDRLEAAGEKGHLTRDNIWMCVFDLFLAGTETTSNTLLWFLLCMASNPAIQKRVRL